MWTEYYLKAPDKATFDAAVPDGGWDGVVLDVIGDLSTPAWTDPDTGEVHSARYVAGWHVNVRCMVELPHVLEDFVVYVPEYPKRVWA